jgi:hypothetical protein
VDDNLTKPVRINKTVKNLNYVWNHLDDATGSLYNAMQNLNLMTDIPQELKDRLDRIDISEIVAIREEIEDMIKAKGATVV